MTAPLTPQDPQPPTPWGQVPVEPKARVSRELVVGAVTTVAVAVSGVLLGLLWLWLAPRVPLISDGSAVYLKDSEGEQAVGADGWFTLLGLGMGVLCALVAFWRRRSGGIALVVGLAAGGVLASVVAWRFGVTYGPESNVVAHAKAVGPNKVFYAPLVLHAKAALLTWPIGAVLGFLALTSLFTSEPPFAPWPGWGPGQPGYGPGHVQGYGGRPGAGDHWVSYTPAEGTGGSAGPSAEDAKDSGEDGGEGRREGRDERRREGGADPRED